MIRFFSILAFLTFFTGVIVRYYSNITVKELESYLPEKDKNKKIFNLKNKVKTVKMLDSLKDVVKRTKVVKKKTKKKINREKMSYEYSLPSLKKEIAKLESAFYAPKDNFQGIRKIQANIRRIKTRNKLKTLNLEKWSPQLILYFIIHEGDEMLEINDYTQKESNRYNSIIVDRDELEEYKKLANSKNFLNRILEFKNIRKINTKTKFENQVKRNIASDDDNYDDENYDDENYDDDDPYNDNKKKKSSKKSSKKKNLKNNYDPDEEEANDNFEEDEIDEVDKEEAFEDDE